jgi:hypothetical protein
MADKRRWSDLSKRTRRLLIGVTVINSAGLASLAYFVFGRRRPQ